MKKRKEKEKKNIEKPLSIDRNVGKCFKAQEILVSVHITLRHTVIKK